VERSHKVTGFLSAQTENIQMVLNKVSSHVVISRWMAADPGILGPFEVHMNTCGCSTGPRNKPQ